MIGLNIEHNRKGNACHYKNIAILTQDFNYVIIQNRFPIGF